MLPCLSDASTGVVPYPGEAKENRGISDPVCVVDDVTVLAQVEDDEIEKARNDEVWRRRREEQIETIDGVTA